VKRLVLFISALADFCRSFASGSLPPTQSASGQDNTKVKDTSTQSSSAVPAVAKFSNGNDSHAASNPVAKPLHGKIGPATSVAMMTVGDLVSHLGAKIDGFNLLEVVQYLRESKLARKVGGVPYDCIFL
jgi:hypothetical protein